MRRTWHQALLALVLAACGGTDGVTGDADAGSDSPTDTSAGEDTIHFDPLGPECMVDGDCDDGDPCTADACDLASWSCRHDSIVGPALVGPDVRITDGPAYAVSPVAAWTGSEIGLVWSDARASGCVDPGVVEPCDSEVFFALLGPGSEIVVEPRPILGGEGASWPEHMTWTGDRFVVGMVTYDLPSSDVGPPHREITVASLDRSGEPVSEPTVAPFLSGPGGMVWTGDEVVVPYSKLVDPGPAFVLAHVPVDGSPVMEVQFEHDNWGFPDLAWTGSLVGIAWPVRTPSDEGLVTVSTMAPHDPGDVELRSLDSGLPTSLRILWNGSAFVTFWASRPDPDPAYESTVEIAILDPTGDVLRSDTLIPEPGWWSLDDPSWTGSEMAVSVRDVDGWSDEGRLIRLTPDGDVVGDPFPLAHHALLAWTGSEYIVAGSHDGAGSMDVYVNRIVVCE